MLFRIVLIIGLGFLNTQIAAHEDLDLGIENVRMDRECHVLITLKNQGRDIPASFYQTVNPAYFLIKKGGKNEQSASLRVLDKHKQLQKQGGTIELRSKTAFANIITPIQVELQFFGEFQDYGAANNKLQKSMDCAIGQGQIAGEKIIPTKVDIAISQARIDPQECMLRVTFINLTKIPMPNSAWALHTGVALTRLDLTTRQRLPDIPLQEIDPQQQFSREKHTLHWQQKLEKNKIQTLRIGLWRVPDDADFSNNHIDITAPEVCKL